MTMAEDNESWLQVANHSSLPPDGSNVGEIIRWYRTRADLNQGAAAKQLSTTQSRLSKIETGSLELDLTELRHVAKVLSIPPEVLGILPDRSTDSIPSAEMMPTPGPIRSSQEEWVRIRRAMNENRAILGNLASELHPQALKVADTSVLTLPQWLPDEPIEVSELSLNWITDPPSPTITGVSPETLRSRALSADGTPYKRYSRVVRDLARPRLFDNRYSYRLLGVDFAAKTCDFSYTTYFDVMDVCEVLGHEFTASWLAAKQKRPSLANLPLRRAIFDPFDLAARPMLPSINTLTIRRDPFEGHRMYLHKRDSQAVAVAGGMYHVVPAGVFQPAAMAPVHQANDFSIWRNIQREFSEEFLGLAEHDGHSLDPIDYDEDEPFKSFAEAKQAGDFRTFVLALVLEPLTLWVEYLTVSVIEAPVFDRLFGSMVSVNEEGSAVSTQSGQPTVGIPFTAESMEKFKKEPLSPIARATIELAWRKRHQLVG
jgi:transcriptional regulator with XRE-family HTH domain